MGLSLYVSLSLSLSLSLFVTGICEAVIQSSKKWTATDGILFSVIDSRDIGLANSRDHCFNLFYYHPNQSMFSVTGFCPSTWPRILSVFFSRVNATLEAA